MAPLIVYIAIISLSYIDIKTNYFEKHASPRERRRRDGYTAFV